MEHPNTFTFVLITGPPGIGKSTYLKTIHRHSYQFIHMNKLFFDLYDKGLIQCTNGGTEPISISSVNMDIHVHFAVRNRQDGHDWRWHRHWKYIHKIKEKKRVIILGVPYLEYINRVEQRKFSGSPTPPPNCNGFLHHYKESYYAWVDFLKENNIPYTFVHAKRNTCISDSYPTLNETDFFKML